jgi:glucans biosynthesis protein
MIAEDNLHRTHLAFAFLAFVGCAHAHAFGFKDVDARAQQRASASYKPPDMNVPNALRDLDEKRYHAIRFQPKATYWQNAKTLFTLQFFHEGWRFIDPVKLNEITPSGVHEIVFDPNRFDYTGSGVTPDVAKGTAFAGFRVHFPLNSADKKDEVLSFLGASYFRALGKDQSYGLSARGLAIDTALASGEEFPRFVEFWIERPKPKSTSMTIYGLLDSPRATGAYEFVLTPGVETTMRVHARLHMRDKVGKLGVAPLTSMFFFGSNQHAAHDDYRPEVHDSDGLSIHASSGEWIWRPLVNPKHLLVTSFALTDPAGFGLMQRMRDAHRYEDATNPYESHPSAWVEPNGPWGAGHIELVEIPSPDETNDNISAYWLSDQPVSDIAYTLHWQKNVETRPATAWISQTLRGEGYEPKPDGSICFVIDFEGPMLADSTPDAPVTALVSGDANAVIVSKKAIRNPAGNGWRLFLRIQRQDDKKSTEMRANLKRGDATSETWSYVLPPE